ncbi:MAG: redoxin domain-containing protein [Elusimicrobia bacterium]|nr:redoxin domain-containing protein [Elusimicrobiota bacterium]
MPRATLAALPLLCALAAPAAAIRPITPPAPELPANHAWLNGEELTLARLRKRRVVLITFINSMSLNSVRTYKVLGAWWQRYNLAGLMIIGVHTPDFDFDSDPLRVKAAIKRYGVQFPVVLDNERLIWRAYGSEGWPTMVLIDHKGQIVFDRQGEGGYREFETEIRDALGRFNRYWAPESLPLVDDPPAKDCRSASPSTYLGSRRGRSIDLTLNPERGRDILASREGETGYKGKWTLERDAARLAMDNPLQHAYVRVLYRGAEGFALLGKSGKPTRMFVKQDDFWLHAGNAGPDVQWDETDRSFVLVSDARLYAVTKNATDAMHELALFPEHEDARAMGFEFSDFCQAPPPRG